jgi:hypothetical protein
LAHYPELIPGHPSAGDLPPDLAKDEHAFIVYDGISIMRFGQISSFNYLFSSGKPRQCLLGI